MAIAELYGKQASAEDLEKEMLSLDLGDFASEAGLEFEVDISIEVSAKRSAGEGISVDLDGFQDDDIVEITLENGLKFYTRVDELADEIPLSGKRDGGNTLELPTHYWVDNDATQDRGAADWLIKKFSILKGKVKDAVVGAAVDYAGTKAGYFAAKKLEEKLIPVSGLFRCVTDAGGLQLEPVNGSLPARQAPVLVFLHGTASNTEGSFGELFTASARDTVRALTTIYGKDGIFALEHKTLTDSPIDNARAVLSSLPDNARVHLVSHSRGGLVGELLCRAVVRRAEGGSTAPFDADDLSLFVDHPLAPELDKLQSELKKKKLVVERFVRVACPAAGTTLASHRADRAFNNMLNLLGLVGGVGQTPVYKFLKSLLLALLKTRTKPGELPGLAAMMPDSPLVAMLNRADAEVDSELRVISGDTEGSGIFPRIGIALTDWFYGSEHDLVVNTPSMRGGIPRPKTKALEFFDHGSDVNHFSYFKNPKTVARIVAGLRGEPGDAALFHPLNAAEPILNRGRRPLDSDAPVAYFLPGVMGSELKGRVNGKQRVVWADKGKLLFGRFNKLEVGDPVDHGDPIGSAYDDFLDFLGRSHHVIPFGYDWRLSVTAAASRLAEDIEIQLEARSDRAIRLIGHSMGGLVIMAFMAGHPETWNKVKAVHGSRVLFLGTPTLGSHAMTRALVGHAKMIKVLALADLKHSKPELLSMIAPMPGLMELVPAYSDAHSNDMHDVAIWDELDAILKKSWSRPPDVNIKSARDVHALLRGVEFDPDLVKYVAGIGKKTPSSMRLETKGGSRKIRFLATNAGDGTVPWAEGIPEGVPTWYMPAEHGDLANFPPAFQALEQLLQLGSTSQLQDRPPVLRESETLELLEEDIVDIYPSDEYLIEAALGAKPRKRQATVEETTLKVSVVHGDLVFANFPVMVGHYSQDSIVRAEAVIDNQLQNQLRSTRDLGLYPGDVGESRVFFGAGQAFRGAIVIGLGVVGQLSRGMLIQSVKSGVISYAIETANAARAGSLEVPQTLGISSLLIGTADSGISMRDTMKGIVEGIRLANAQLKQHGDGLPLLTDLQFIELYRETAIAATHCLRELMLDDTVGRVATLQADTLLSGEGGRYRVRLASDEDWWRRIQITANEQGEFSFLVARRLARLEDRFVRSDVELLQNYVEEAIRNPGDVRVAETLFEFMLPNAMKEQSQDDENLVLMLDTETAPYPWELMRDRRDQRGVPMAVKAGMIRQLRRSSFSETVEYASGQQILIVGDTQPVEGYVALKGAQEEARAVEDRFDKKNGWEPTHLHTPSAPELISNLLTCDYRVLHLAGHGDVLKKDLGNGRSRHVQGMVIGKNVLLDADLIKKMRTVPELAFINCCHVGSAVVTPGEKGGDSGRPNELAASLALELIDRGVKVVIAAAWAISDVAAKVFAEQFYDSMLSGSTFGEAVRAARERIFYAYGATDNTWGAYQCYGDTEYRLVSRPHFTSAGASYHYLSFDDACCQFDTFNSKIQKPRSIAAITRELERRCHAVPAEWFAKHGRLCVSVANCFASIKDFKGAVKYYEMAIGADDGEATLIALEQMANCMVRDGIRDGIPGKGFFAAADRALALLESLSAWPTPERFELQGGVHKRRSQGYAYLALASENETSRKKYEGQAARSLRAMTKAYENAAAEERKVRSQNWSVYAPSNYFAGRCIDALVFGKSMADEERNNLQAQVAELLHRAREKEAAEPDFWNLVTIGDCVFLLDLASTLERKAPALDDEILAVYRQAWNRGGSAKSLDSVIAQYRFIHTLLILKAPTARSRSKAARLSRLVSELIAELESIAAATAD